MLSVFLVAYVSSTDNIEGCNLIGLIRVWLMSRYEETMNRPKP